MNDFEGLLDEVLREDSHVEPRVGMEARIVARVSMAPETSRRRWIVWTPAVVCALLLAILLDREPRKAAVQRIQPAEVASRNEPRPGHVLDLPQRGIATAPVRVRSDKRKSKPAIVPANRLPPVTAIRIAPLEVAALSLRPLGITPLELTETKER